MVLPTRAEASSTLRLKSFMMLLAMMRVPVLDHYFVAARVKQ
jgi:hypothetical protein